MNTLRVPRNRPCHVLIVEDNPDGRESLRLLLELLGYSVDVAADGFEGVKKALARHPRLALIDLDLPVLDGYQVARRVRKVLGHDILLVAYTAHDDIEARVRVVQAGFDGHLVKPATLDELLSWLDCTAEASGAGVRRVPERECQRTPA